MKQFELLELPDDMLRWYTMLSQSLVHFDVSGVKAFAFFSLLWCIEIFRFDKALRLVPENAHFTIWVLASDFLSASLFRHFSHTTVQ